MSVYRFYRIETIIPDTITQVFKGLKDVKEGNTLSMDELLQRVKKWAK